MLLGEIVPVTPIVNVGTRFTVPLNPLVPATVSVELPLVPARIVIAEGFAATTKSTT
jgi:hypothetical protein